LVCYRIHRSLAFAQEQKAEGCFGLYIYTNANSKTGWFISLVFKISLHEKDKIILEQIKKYFGVGVIISVAYYGSTFWNYSVRSHKYLQIIIDYFYKFPLKTNKLNDYKLFKLAYILILKKEHLTLEGIKKLVSIKSSMNLGLSPELKTILSNIEPEKKENISNYKIPDPNW
jgi:LAGLIDADG endonuclease